MTISESARAHHRPDPIPIRPPHGRPPGASRLPRPLTSFVGRARETDEITTLLSQSGIRLLSLTGPGGVGKTRLAIRVAEKSSDAWEEIWFVTLASISAGDLFMPAIAHSVGLREAGDAPAVDRLIALFGDRRTLLILDNMEQLVSAASQLVMLLEACPNLTLLVTTRTLLRISGEFDYLVPPLELPAPPVRYSLEDLDDFAGFGDEKETLVRSSYDQNYDRLAELKAIYDPGNLFRMNNNIKPAAMAAAAD